jgi:hypothetical protein
MLYSNSNLKTGRVMSDGIPSLGRLASMDLRDVWPSEPGSFTPWLAHPENLQFLAEALGMPGLELVGTEQTVDIFSADIVARTPDTGETVLIENQLERSDHTHLGQILTYAAGLDAAIIVWITRKFIAGHRAALDWLNSITNEKIAFFGVEVDAVRIDSSIPAPRFVVVARPNDWTRKLKVASAQSEATPETIVFTRFWNGYDEKARAMGAPVRIAPSQVKSANYYVRFGTAGKIYLTAYRSVSSGTVGVYLAMFEDQSREIFETLREKRALIEKAFGAPLEWLEKKMDAVYWVSAGSLKAELDEADWPRQHAWLASTMKRLHGAIEPFIANLVNLKGED